MTQIEALEALERSDKAMPGFPARIHAHPRDERDAGLQTDDGR